LTQEAQNLNFGFFGKKATHNFVTFFAFGAA